MTAQPKANDHHGRAEREKGQGNGTPAATGKNATGTYAARTEARAIRPTGMS